MPSIDVSKPAVRDRYKSRPTPASRAPGTYSDNRQAAAIGATDTVDTWQDALDESPDDYAAELRAAGVRS